MTDSTALGVIDQLADERHADAGALAPFNDWPATTVGALEATGALWLKNGFPQGGHNSDGTGTPHLRPFNVTTSGRIDLTQIKSIATPEPSVPHWLRPGDVIFNNTNSEELVGKTAYFEIDLEAVISNHMTILRVTDPNVVDPQWLAYQLLFEWHRRTFLRLCRRHVNQASISLQRLRGVEVPVPPLSEQRGIAHVLRNVQQAREATGQVIEATRELKRSLMRHLFTYGPVPVDEADQVTRKEIEFGDIPEHWSVEPLECVARVQTGVAKGRKLRSEDVIEVPYLRVANVQDGYLDLSEMKTIQLETRELDRFRLQSNDVVVTEDGDFDKLGRGFIWRDQVPGAVHQNHVFAVRADPTRVTPDYLAYLFQAHLAKRYFLKVAHRTTNLASINSRKLKSLPTPIPSFEEQRSISSMLESVDAKIRVEEQRRETLSAMFQSLLHYLMSGKVRVPMGEGATEPEEATA